MRLFSSLLLALLILCSPALAEDFQGSTHVQPYEDEVIGYEKHPPQDAVAQLQAKLARGQAQLEWDEHLGWLPSVLRALGVPASSQMLVFSKTSLQRHHIHPANPRALYFSDDVYVGYIPQAPTLEISAVDPRLGSIFYTLEQEPSARPTFTRNSDCLQCHASGRTLGVPGIFVRSLQTDERGELQQGTETQEVNHCTPLAQRWGGWYVTGQLGSQAHLGNLIGPAAFARQAQAPAAASLATLEGQLDTGKYLTPRSDVAALMVLEHQTHMHNYLTRLNYEARIMLERYGHIRYLKSQTEAFLRYLLFTEEAPLAAPIQGHPQFTRDFAQGARRDPQGRSLRDLDLQTRMFRYPCSYLIYSPAFDALPGAMRDHLLERLFQILSGQENDPQFAKIAPADRQAVLEILRATKPNLPAYWAAVK